MRAASRPRVDGAALLLVLWLIVLRTALVGGFAMVARVERLQGQVLVRGLAAQGAARAGVEYALSRVELTDPRLQWQPNGQPYQWNYAGAEVEVRIVDENGKVDLNQADATVLGNLLLALGVEQVEAARLAAAIIDWRDPDQLTQAAGGAEDRDYASAGRPYGAKDAGFEGIAELQQVLGFSPEVYALVEPNVTVYSGLPRPDPAFAPAPVLYAIGLDGEEVVAARGRFDPAGGPPSASGSGTYSIDSLARLAGGRQSLLRVVVRAGGNGIPGMAYTALRWEEGASPR